MTKEMEIASDTSRHKLFEWASSFSTQLLEICFHAEAPLLNKAKSLKQSNLDKVQLIKTRILVNLMDFWYWEG